MGDSHHLQQRQEGKMPSKEKLTEAFEKADTEKTGKITLKQLQEILLATGECEDEKKMFQNKGFVDGLLCALDDNEDGELTLEELLKYAGEGDDMTKEMGVKMIKRLVENADKDKDGFLTAKELKVFLMMFQPSEDEKRCERMIDTMIRMCSHDGSRKVKADVVVQFCIDPREIEKSRDPKKKAEIMFKMFDTNLDGYIGTKELAEYMRDFPNDPENDEMIEMMMSLMIAKYDKDEDGKLNYEEFEKFLARHN